MNFMPHKYHPDRRRSVATEYKFSALTHAARLSSRLTTSIAATTST